MHLSTVGYIFLGDHRSPEEEHEEEHAFYLVTHIKIYNSRGYSTGQVPSHTFLLIGRG